MPWSEQQQRRNALLSYLREPPGSLVLDGEDPPDLYLKLHDGTCVAVEVTRLTQPTVNADGSCGNRTSHDYFGLQLIEELNVEFGPKIPDTVSLVVVLHLPASNGRSFKRDVRAFIEGVLRDPVPGTDVERLIEGAKVSVTVIHESHVSKKIRGLIANRNSSADILRNARHTLEDRIRVKNSICCRLPTGRQVWLALLNDYWLADADTYRMAMSQVRFPHSFERIFIVSDQARVVEL